MNYADYGEALGEAVVVLIVVFVSVVLVAGDGFTTVVLFSVFLSAGGVTVSVFCSHAANNAAVPARMQMYFFISCRWKAQCGFPQYSAQACLSALPKYEHVRSG